MFKFKVIQSNLLDIQKLVNGVLGFSITWDTYSKALSSQYALVLTKENYDFRWALLSGIFSVKVTLDSLIICWYFPFSVHNTIFILNGLSLVKEWSHILYCELPKTVRCKTQEIKFLGKLTKYVKGFWYEVPCLNYYQSLIEKSRIVNWKCGIGMRPTEAVSRVKSVCGGLCLLLNELITSYHVTPLDI